MEHCNVLTGELIKSLLPNYAACPPESLVIYYYTIIIIISTVQ